jgi:hypothetical protein
MKQRDDIEGTKKRPAPVSRRQRGRRFRIQRFARLRQKSTPIGPKPALLQQSEQRAASTTHIEKIRPAAIPRGARDECNVAAQRQLPVYRFKFLQRTRLRGIPPILSGIEARNLFASRHGIQKETSAGRACIQRECL